jgi:aconitase B
MKLLTGILLALLLGICTQLHSQVVSSENYLEKKSVNEGDLIQLFSKNAVIVNDNSETIKTATSGLAAYERLLKEIEAEKKILVKKGQNTDELNSQIVQLKEKIRFEKNKSLPEMNQQNRDMGNSTNESKILK